ncbi:hypothetical protein KP79_PYT10980 [Mizuhopecten yessoensis]|uniref:Uncharacterized protein n=1 Tax=Mizuhopecten yessoensis TaxID=6573 RepID=A0A210PZM1_MIZYE|nr:hypothetical protein KP79_PYT10980 [Mizuhopecten yessoensis]
MCEERNKEHLVSVISPTSRNHYLNITPANVVCVYSNKSEGLTRLRFVDKDKALPTVLKDLEREMMAELTPQRPGTNTAQSRLNMGTPDIRNPQARLNTGTPDIRNPQSRLNMGTPDIRNPQSRLNMGTPDIRNQQSRFNMGTPNFRTPQSRLNMGTPDIRIPQSRFNMGTPDNRTPQSRFNVGNVENNSVTPPKSYPVGARTPGIGLSGVQGASVSRTGSFTPQRGPGQSVIPGNNGANMSGVGVTRTPVGVSLSKTGPYTPQNVTDQNFTPQRYSTPDHQQRTPQRGAAPGNRIPVGGTTAGNSTPQGGSAPGNSIPQGGATPGSVTPTTPGVTNPYRFKPQNPGQNTFRPENQLEGNQSNLRISEAKSTVLSGYNTPKFPNTERTSSDGVDVSPSPLTNSHVTGRCRVSSSSAVSISAQHSKITTGCASVNTNSDNVSTTRVSPTNTTSSAVNTPNRKGFKFKSTKSLTSPDNSLGSSMGQKPGSFAPGGSTIIGSVPSMPDLLKESNNGVESLWQDDLSDDLLSQLSEELV